MGGSNVGSGLLQIDFSQTFFKKNQNKKVKKALQEREQAKIVHVKKRNSK